MTLEDIHEIITLEYVKDQKVITDNQQDSVLIGLVNEVNSTIHTDVILKTDQDKIVGTNFFITLRTPAMLLFQARYALQENSDQIMHDSYVKQYDKSIAKTLNSMRKFSRISGWS